MGRGKGSEKEEQNPIPHIFSLNLSLPLLLPCLRLSHRLPTFFSQSLAAPTSSLFTPATQATHIFLSISRCPYFFPVYACHTGYPHFSLNLSLPLLLPCLRLPHRLPTFFSQSLAAPTSSLVTPATQATHIFLSISRCPYFFPVYACYTGYPHFSLNLSLPLLLPCLRLPHRLPTFFSQSLAAPTSSLFTPATQATHIFLSISRCPYFFPVYACHTGYPYFSLNLSLPLLLPCLRLLHRLPTFFSQSLAAPTSSLFTPAAQTAPFFTTTADNLHLMRIWYFRVVGLAFFSLLRKDGASFCYCAYLLRIS